MDNWKELKGDLEGDGCDPYGQTVRVRIPKERIFTTAGQLYGVKVVHSTNTPTFTPQHMNATEIEKRLRDVLVNTAEQHHNSAFDETIYDHLHRLIEKEHYTIEEACMEIVRDRDLANGTPEGRVDLVQEAQRYISKVIYNAIHAARNPVPSVTIGGKPVGAGGAGSGGPVMDPPSMPSTPSRAKAEIDTKRVYTRAQIDEYNNTVKTWFDNYANEAGAVGTYNPMKYNATGAPTQWMELQSKRKHAEVSKDLRAKGFTVDWANFHRTERAPAGRVEIYGIRLRVPAHGVSLDIYDL